MKKAKKSSMAKVSKNPPPGWPSESEWVEIEKKLGKSKPTKILPRDATVASLLINCLSF